MSRYLDGTKIIHEYKGFTYQPEDDVEEDNVKRFHEVYFNGDRISGGWMPLSPYTTPSFELFSRWIDMGRPTRDEMGGNRIVEHTAYYEKWVAEQLEKELEL